MRCNQLLTAYLVVAVTVLGIPAVGQAQPCPCNGDVAGPNTGCWTAPDGVTTLSDILFILTVLREGDAVETCGALDPDINCDGLLDYCDVGVALFDFQGYPAPCDFPCGACCISDPDYPPCVQFQEDICSNPLIMAPGVYHGDGSLCNPSPCDCDLNGIEDRCDIDCGPLGGDCRVPGCGQGADCNYNGIVDDCEWGACCYTVDGIQTCATSTKATCEDPSIDGVFRGPCAECPEQEPALIMEPSGDVFTHGIVTPMECPPEGKGLIRAIPRDCEDEPMIDPWSSPANGVMCHSFDPGVGGQPIPADFFGPGSDPFTGSICLEGVPLGDPTFPDADTLIERAEDPFDPCVLVSFPVEADPVDLEVIALSLANKLEQPVTVTYNGGMDPEMWDAVVTLSETHTAPVGTLIATKTHCNGGTYVSELNVWPQYTLTRRGDSEVRVFTPDSYLTLSQVDPAPWVHWSDENLGATQDICSYFHGGLDDISAVSDCDCNLNDMVDTCEIDERQTPDCNGNGVPDECDISAGTSMDDDSDGIPDECTTKTRYVSFSPGHPGEATALRVLMTDSALFPEGIGQDWWWVQEHRPSTPADVFYLGHAPYYRDWGTAPGVIHVTGCQVVPHSEYEIRALPIGLGIEDPNNYYGPITRATTRTPAPKAWGDCVGGYTGSWGPANGIVNMNDVMATLQQFSSEPTAPPMVWVDVGPQEPEASISMTDVQLLVLAFQGNPYAFISPADCP